MKKNEKDHAMEKALSQEEQGRRSYFLLILSCGQVRYVFVPLLEQPYPPL